MEGTRRKTLLALSFLLAGSSSSFAQQSAPSPVRSRGQHGGGVYVFDLPGNNRIQYSPPNPNFTPSSGRPSNLKPRIIRTERSQKAYEDYEARRKRLQARIKSLRSRMYKRRERKAGAGDKYLAERKQALVGDRYSSKGVEKKEIFRRERNRKKNLELPVLKMESAPAPPSEEELARKAIQEERASIRERMAAVNQALREKKLAREAAANDPHRPRRYGIYSPGAPRANSSPDEESGS